MSDEIFRGRTRADAEPEAGAIPCPGYPGHKCRRRIGPEMMRNVSGLEATVTGGAAFLCDACCDQLHETGRVSRADLARAQGAPDDWCQAIEAKDARRAVDAERRR